MRKRKAQQNSIQSLIYKTMSDNLLYSKTSRIFCVSVFFSSTTFTEKRFDHFGGDLLLRKHLSRSLTGKYVAVLSCTGWSVARTVKKFTSLALGYTPAKWSCDPEVNENSKHSTWSGRNPRSNTNWEKGITLQRRACVLWNIKGQTLCGS